MMSLMSVVDDVCGRRCLCWLISVVAMSVAVMSLTVDVCGSLWGLMSEVVDACGCICLWW